MHTKRSPEFEEKIKRVIAELETGDQDAIADAIEILKKNTTDAACIVNAKDDEPVFVLRGQDILAGDVVRFWASGYLELRGVDRLTVRRQTIKIREKHHDALKCAAEMTAYHDQKVPD